MEHFFLFRLEGPAEEGVRVLFVDFLYISVFVKTPTSEILPRHPASTNINL